MGNYKTKINNLIKYSYNTFNNDNPEDVQNNARKAIEAFCKIIIISFYGQERGNKIIFSQDNKWNRQLKVTQNQQKRKQEFVLSMLLKVVLKTHYPNNEISKSKKIDLSRTIELIIFKGNSSSHESSPIIMDNDDTIITQKLLAKLLRWLFLDFLKIEIPDKLILYIGKYDIFLSYRHTDIEWVRLLETNLKSQGYTIFRDEYHLIAGEKTKEVLSNAIEKSKCGIIIYPSKDDSNWIKNEIELMKERQRKDSNFKIIPIVIDSTKHILDKDIIYIDFTKKSYIESFNKLICAIKGTPPLKNCIKNKIQLPKKKIALEDPIGSIPINSPFYITRYSNKKAIQNLEGRYTLIRIKAPSQYGKTSLLNRLTNQSEKNKYFVVYFNFEEFDKFLLKNLEELLTFICDMIAYELNITIDLNPKIAKLLTPKTITTKKMAKILSKIPTSLVIAIDEADRLFEYKDVSDEFFSLLRAWYENGKSDPLWEKLKIILSHSTEPLLGISNINQSPFHNVGVGIEIQPFNKREIDTLAKRYNIFLNKNELNDIKEFLGGHPYLTQQTLYTMTMENKSLSDIIKESNHRNSIFKKHMQHYLLKVKDNPKLIAVLKDIIQNKRTIDDKSCYILEATGLIRDFNGKFQFSCKLYHDFFNRKL